MTAQRRGGGQTHGRPVESGSLKRRSIRTWRWSAVFDPSLTADETDSSTGSRRSTATLRSGGWWWTIGEMRTTASSRLGAFSFAVEAVASNLKNPPGRSLSWPTGRSFACASSVITPKPSKPPGCGEARGGHHLADLRAVHWAPEPSACPNPRASTGIQAPKSLPTTPEGSPLHTRRPISPQTWAIQCGGTVPIEIRSGRVPNARPAARSPEPKAACTVP